MKIILPKTSGFCYGVYLAVKEAENIIEGGKGLIMYGELVHNPDVVAKLEEKGGVTVGSVEEIKDCPRDSIILVRAHGVPKSTERELLATGHAVVDKTCPKVKKVHKTVEEEEKKGRRIIIVGNPHHPEVIGILGQCKGEARVISTAEEAALADLSGDISVVVQTTFNGKTFEEIREIIGEKNKDAVVYNTMCPATSIRQKEIEELSAKADYVVVLGGKKSSNSMKLCKIAERNTKAVLVEDISEIPLGELEGKERVVVCGGSSTPYDLIESAALYLQRLFGAELVKLEKE